MNRLTDILRMVTLSPELLIALATIAIHKTMPSAGNLALALLNSDHKWAVGIVVVIPITLLVSCYQLGTEILSPQGKRKVLLEWPDYWRLKYRVVYALAVCAIALFASLIGYLLVLNRKSPAAAMLIIGAWAVAATTTASLALAKWSTREILGE
ncbi:MAG: hypothetical protein QMD44_02550 [Thermodesulfovibrionales bacterium]|jgi:hypothetical protein|nr:hypothetical protein [Thermodesulfovibrionales bacterium]